MCLFYRHLTKNRGFCCRKFGKWGFCSFTVYSRPMKIFDKVMFYIGGGIIFYSLFPAMTAISELFIDENTHPKNHYLILTVVGGLYIAILIFFFRAIYRAIITGYFKKKLINATNQII